MDLDVVDLSRAQFALTIMFHYLFPPLSIGLGVIMVVLEGLALKTGDDAYRISVAVAGFGEDDLNVEVKDAQLTVTAKKREVEGAEKPVYLHRGIAERGFERRFQLAEHVQVKGANLEHGLLHIDLVREVPEALKPRNIAIGAPKAIKA